MNTYKILGAVVAVVLFAGAAAQADTVIYSEYFTYPDNTPLGSVPGWYDWGSGNVTIQSGKAFASGSMDWLLNMTDIFSSTSQARIEFDLLSYQQDSLLFGPGDAATLSFSYTQTLGFQHGAGLLYNFNDNGFDYGYQPTAPNPLTAHWVIDMTLSGTFGTDLEWSATYDGNPLFPGTKTFTMNQAFDTFEWDTLGGAGSTLDNLVITAIPEPATMSLLVLGGVATLLKHRRKA